MNALVMLTLLEKLLPFGTVVTIGFTERLASPRGPTEAPPAQLIILRSSVAAPGLP